MYFHHELAYRPQVRRPFQSGHPKHRFGGTLASTNVRETETQYELHLVAPGRAKDAFKLRVSAEHVLNISYEAPESGDQQWLHREFHLGSFERSFRLSEAVDTAKVSAAYDNGILVVTLPKREDAQKAALEIPVR